MSSMTAGDAESSDFTKDSCFNGLPKASYLTDNRPFRPVDALQVDGVVDVYVRRGAQLSLVVAAEHREDFYKVITTISGSTLSVRSEGVGGRIIMAGGTVTINGVSYPGTNAQIGGFKGKVAVGIVLPCLESVSVLGSANTTLIDLSQSNLEIAVKGSGNVYAQGAVGYLNVNVRGSGDVKAKTLNAREARLQVVGSGDIKAFVREAVDAHVIGSGDIKVYGNPVRREKRVTGTGTVKFK